mgnify:CR=1 FL=1
MATIIIWKGKGKYQFVPAGQYDGTRYPAEVRKVPHYRLNAYYCETVQEAVKMFRLDRWEVQS